MMKVDNIIELENNKKYGILMETELTDKDYFLAVLLNEKEEPTKNYIILEEVKNNNETFVKKINDPLILNQILENYKLQYEEEYGE